MTWQGWTVAACCLFLGFVAGLLASDRRPAGGLDMDSRERKWMAIREQGRS